MSLFASEFQPLSLPEAEIHYCQAFFTQEEADRYYQQLLEETPWQQDDIKVFGKVYPQPRLTALYGENGQPYSYSNIVMHPHPFTPALSEIKEKIELSVSTKFNTVLLNLYRSGKDSNGWHADDERELGHNPVIASVSFGAPRAFHFRHKKDKSLRHKLTLEHGSLLIMEGTTQHCWQHQIPKTAKTVAPRINLTFRVLKN